MVDPKDNWAKKVEELKKDRKFEEAVGILKKVDYYHNKILNLEIMHKRCKISIQLLKF